MSGEGAKREIYLDPPPELTKTASLKNLRITHAVVFTTNHKI
jgi:hypothetical protein